MFLLHLYKEGIKFGFGRGSSDILAIFCPSLTGDYYNSALKHHHSAGLHGSGKIALSIWIKSETAE